MLSCHSCKIYLHYSRDTSRVADIFMATSAVPSVRSRVWISQSSARELQFLFLWFRSRFHGAIMVLLSPTKLRSVGAGGARLLTSHASCGHCRWRQLAAVMVVREVRPVLPFNSQERSLPGKCMDPLCVCPPYRIRQKHALLSTSVVPSSPSLYIAINSKRRA